jgi:pSer/pThr/pTyr-binding forkhead associated (FHA) protein
MATRFRYWLQMAQEPGQAGDEGVQIKPGGSTMGRALDCDIIFPQDDNDIHRYHATLRPRFDGLRIYRDGRNPVLVNGKPVDERAELADGDQIRIGRYGFVVGAEPYSSEGPVWLLGGVGRNLLPVAPSLTLGDGEDDTARIKGWPEGALELFEAEGKIVLDTRQQTPTLNGRQLDKETQEPLSSGARIGLLGHEIRLLASTGGTGKTTVVKAADAPPVAIILTWEPAGATLVVAYPTGVDVSCWLAEKRAELLNTLMRPPAPYKPGDVIPDDVLIDVLWPKDLSKSRVELNGLIYHTRRALLKKGIDGYVLIVKKGGGVTLGVSASTELTTIE